MEGSAELASFCRREYPRLVGALSLYCGDRHVAEELAQEAIARVCRDWHRVKGMDAPGAWTHRVAINLANSHLRRRAAERNARQRLAARGTEVFDEPDTASAVALRQAVAKLPRRQRIALVYRYYLDLSVREAAELMECPDGTVKTLTARAISNLRREDLIEAGGVPDAI
ncbi:MAG: RNA polymerase sigma factor [Actinomycetota bacterium]